MYSGKNFNDIVNNNNLHEYYKNVFPNKYINKWLTINNKLGERDITLSIRPNEGEDYVIKYIKLYNCKKLKSTLINETPYRIDISSNVIFDINKNFIKSMRQVLDNCSEIIYKSKELVFDIDIEPFDWNIIKKNMIILNKTLINIFGFKNILFVFSGKKGIHCWVSDKEAMNYNDSKRMELLDWIKFNTDMDINYLDDDVIKLSHNAKLPFNVHAITGKLCVPLDINNIDNININEIPLLTDSKDIILPYINLFKNIINNFI
jgi:DNA primase small subunit